MNIIRAPFAWLFMLFYSITHSYGLSILLFALVVKLILLPFQMKSKKSTMRMSSLNPRIKELEKKYEGDQQKYQEAVAKLYKDEKVNPMSGCLWSLIPFPILIALYQVVRQPLTCLMKLTSDQVTLLTEKFTELGLYDAGAVKAAYSELALAEVIHGNFDTAKELVSEVLDLNFNFLGMNLAEFPQWNFFTKVDWSNAGEWLPALGLFLIPFISAFLSYLSSKVASRGTATDTNGTANTMLLTMPLISLYICFVMPGVMGVYWIASSVFAILQELLLNKRFEKILQEEDAERQERNRMKEAELAHKRQETEKLRAEGNTAQNPNTSKKRLQAAERSREEERQAAQRALEKAAQREADGEELPEEPSRVGNRPYARGRAYDPDRFGKRTEPEEAAAPAEEAEETVPADENENNGSNEA